MAYAIGHISGTYLIGDTITNLSVNPAAAHRSSVVVKDWVYSDFDCFALQPLIGQTAARASWLKYAQLPSGGVSVMLIMLAH